MRDLDGQGNHWIREPGRWIPCEDSGPQRHKGSRGRQVDRAAC
jgi:hypothetical protein